MAKLYLDSSAVVKRYVVEDGSESVAQIYEEADAKEITICFSIWNIGEAIGVIDYYQRRNWITEDQGKRALNALAGETRRLLRIEGLELIPVNSSTLGGTWDLVRIYHIYQADALQIVSCSRSGADAILSADRALLEAAKGEGLVSVNIEDAREAQEKIFRKWTRPH